MSFIGEQLNSVRRKSQKSTTGKQGKTALKKRTNYQLLLLVIHLT